MYLVTRNSPLIQEQQMPRPACAPPVLSAPLFLESVCGKKSEIPSEFQTVWICRARPGPHCLQTKNDRHDAPTHPLTEIPEIGHERHTQIKSGGPGSLTIAVPTDC